MPVFTAEKISYAAALLANWKGKEPQAVRDGLDDLADLLAPLTLMDPNSVLVRIASGLPAGLIMRPGSVLVRNLTGPSPDIRDILIPISSILETDGLGNFRSRSFAAKSWIITGGVGALTSLTVPGNRWMITTVSGAPGSLGTLANMVMVTEATGAPLFLLPGVQTCIGRKAGNLIVHTFADATFMGKKDGTTDWGNLTMATARTMLGLKYGALLEPIGLYATSTTAKTTLSQDTTYFLYLGNIGRAFTTCEVLTRVVTAVDAGGGTPWAEIGIFTGTFVPNGNASLMRRGSLDVLSPWGSTGIKKETVTPSGISDHDDVWIAFGSKGSPKNFELRGTIADDVQSGVFQSVSGKLSDLATPVTTTLESATEVPAWIRVAI